MTNEVFAADPLAGDLTALVQSQQVVLFVGSGLSSGIYWSWDKLVQELCRRCGVVVEVALSVDSGVGPLLDYAEQALQKDENSYLEVLGEQFARPVVKTNQAYAIILGAPFKSYVTINFDPLLATAAQGIRNRVDPALQKCTNRHSESAPP